MDNSLKGITGHFGILKSSNTVGLLMSYFFCCTLATLHWIFDLFTKHTTQKMFQMFV